MLWVADIVIAQAQAAAPAAGGTDLATGGGIIGAAVILWRLIEKLWLEDALERRKRIKGVGTEESDAKAKTRALIEGLAGDAHNDRVLMQRIAELQRDTARELAEGRREGREAHARIEAQLADIRRRGD